LLPTGFNIQPSSWVDSAFVKWFINFDENVLRPFLIYKYSYSKVMQEDKFEDMVKSQIKQAEMMEQRMDLVASYRDMKLINSLEPNGDKVQRSQTTVDFQKQYLGDSNDKNLLKKGNQSQVNDKRNQSLPNFQPVARDFKDGQKSVTDNTSDDVPNFGQQSSAPNLAVQKTSLETLEERP